MFRSVPEAPRVYPKYYTQTVAITSKPEIPHSTFLIPAARLLSWAPHEEPLLEREVMYRSVCLSLSLSQSSCSFHSLSPAACLPLSILLPVLGFVVDSPTHFFLHLIVYFSPYLVRFPSPTDAVSLQISSCLQGSYFASFSFVSLPLSLRVSRYSCRDFLTC